MIKLIKLLQELEKPEKIYQDDSIDNAEKVDNLSAQQKQELFDKGFLIINNKVYNLPKIDKKRKEIVKSKKEFNVYSFYPDDDIKEAAKEVNMLHNKLYQAMTALDDIIKLKKVGKL